MGPFLHQDLIKRATSSSFGKFLISIFILHCNNKFLRIYQTNHFNIILNYKVRVANCYKYWFYLISYISHFISMYFSMVTYYSVGEKFIRYWLVKFNSKVLWRLVLTQNCIIYIYELMNIFLFYYFSWTYQSIQKNLCSILIISIYIKFFLYILLII